MSINTKAARAKRLLKNKGLKWAWVSKKVKAPASAVSLAVHPERTEKLLDKIIKLLQAAK